MNLNYFKEYIDPSKNLTEDYLKGTWRKIVLYLHPDKGGNEEKFKQAQAEYEYLLKSVNAGFSAFSDSPESFDSWEEFLAGISPVVAEAFQQAVQIPKIELEICGWWIWVTMEKSNTDARMAIKAIDVNGKKFRWAREKKKWYFAGRKSYNRTPVSIEEIRAKYGSVKYHQEKEEKRELVKGN